MAISSKTDIVLGVSLAADPLKYMEAMDRLRQTGPSSQSEFATFLAGQGTNPGASGDPTASTGPEDALNSGPPVPESARAAVRRKAGAKDVYGQLEAFIMQTFIQSMLPKEATSVFGKGTAGDVWKSMLAEKLGGEVARSGQLGIASRLAKMHLGAGGLPAREMSATQPPVTATVRSLNGDLSRAPNALANALTALQEQPAGKAQPDKNGWITTVHVAERS